MATLPVGATLYVHQTNSRYPLLFTVRSDGLERYSYWSSGARFKSVRKAHYYCSAHGNILKVEVKEAKFCSWEGTPSMTLTAGEFQRAKLSERPKLPERK